MKIGFIDKRGNPGGPALYFSNATDVLFLIRSSFYLAQTLLADAVVVSPSLNLQRDQMDLYHWKVYRCHTVWRPISQWIVLFPLCLWTTLVGKPRVVLGINLVV